MAIIAVALVTVAVVAGSGVEGESAGGTAETTAPALDEPQLDAEGNETDGDRPAGRGGKYVVKEGDTLSAIAAQEGVSVEALLAANPDIDPQALVAGERLKLP